MKRIKLIKAFGFIFKDIRQAMILCLCVSALSAPVMLISPKLFQILIDDTLADGKKETFIFVALGLVGVYILRLAFDGLMLYSTNRVSNTFTFLVRKKMWKKIYHSANHQFSKNDAGNLKLQLMDDVNNISMFIKEQLIDLIYNGIIAIVATILLFLCNPLMALLSIWVFPLVFYANHKIAVQTEKINEEIRVIQSGYYNSTLNAIKNSKEIKIHNAESTFVSRFEYFRDKLAFLGIKNAKYWFYVDFLADIKANYLSKIFIYCLGLVFVLWSHMTIGNVIMFAEYFGLLFSALDLINTRNALLKTDSPYFNRVNEILNLKDVEDGKKEFNFQHEISVNIQEFSYPEDTKAVLKNISFNIQKGEFVVLVGASGCGKTTISKLILNMYPMPRGDIFIDGIPITEISRESIYNNIAYVDQDEFVFNMTIRENFLLVAPQATDDKIWEICNKIGIANLIQNLECGLDTRIGEIGRALSGGQKQMLCIARALLRQPQIIILDESTNALDQMSENNIISTILHSYPLITIIAVSHKPSMIAQANRIIDIERINKNEE